MITTEKSPNLKLISIPSACSVSRLVAYFFTDSQETITDRATDSRCSQLSHNTTGSVRFPNGVVCFNGTTQGSTAVYICDQGYHLDNDIRVCQHNGNWSGDVVVCLPTTKTQGEHERKFKVVNIMIVVLKWLYYPTENSRIKLYKFVQQTEMHLI